jgi:serpin B
VIHQAFVDVNEQGTEAAAAMAIAIAMPTMALGAPRTRVFNSDHPFMFMIQDAKMGSILLIGRFSDVSEY